MAGGGVHVFGEYGYPVVRLYLIPPVGLIYIEDDEEETDAEDVVEVLNISDDEEVVEKIDISDDE